MPSIGTAYLQIVPSFRGVSTALASQVDAPVQRSAARGAASFARTFGGAAIKVGAIGAGAVATVGGLLGGTALKKGLDRALDLQNAQAKLEGLGHSTKDVTRILDNALTSVRGTSFGLGEAATVAASAVAAGVKPGRDLTAYLKLTADTATIAGTSIGEMAGLLNKSTASGKVFTDQLNQLSDRGIPIFGFLADHYHVSQEALSKMVSAGKVDATTLDQVLQEHLGGAALKSGDTAQGAFANLGAAFSRLGVLFVAGPVAEAPRLFQTISASVDSFGGAVKPLADVLSKELVHAMIGVERYLTGLDFTKIGETLTRVAGGVHAVFHGINAPPSTAPLEGLAGVGQKIANAFRAVGTALHGAFSGKGVDLSGFGKSFQTVLSVAKPLAPVAVQAAKGLGGIAGSIGNVISSGLPVLGHLLDNVADVLKFLGQNSGLITPLVLSLVAAGVGLHTLGEITTIAKSIAAPMQLASSSVNFFSGAMKLATSGTQVWAGVTKVASIAQAAFNLVLDANPISIIVIAIAALVAGLVLFFSQTKVGQQAWAAFTGFLGEAFANVGKVISDVVGTVVNVVKAVIGFVAANWPLLLAIVGGPIGAIVAFVITHFSQIRDFVVSVFTAVASFVSGAIDRVVNFVKTGIALLALGWTLEWKAIQTVVTTVWNAISSFVSGAIDGVVRFVKTGIALLALGWNTEWKAIHTVVTTVWNAISSFVSGAIDGVVKFVKDGIALLRLGWQIEWAAISSVVSQVWDTITGTVRGAISGVISLVSGIQQKVTGALSGAAQWLIDTGKNIVAGLVQGFRGAITAAIDTIKGLINLLPQGVRDILGIHSPSTVFAAIGRFVGGGLVQGLEGTAAKVQTATTNLADKVKTAFDNLATNREAAQKRLKVLNERLAEDLTPNKKGKVTTAASTITALRQSIDTQKAIVTSSSLSKKQQSTIVATVTADNAKLNDLAKKRDGIAARLKTANDTLAADTKTRDDFAAGVTSAVTSLGEVTKAVGDSVTDADGNTSTAAVTAANIEATLRNAVTQSTAFAGTLASLKASGLNDTTYSQLLAAFQSSGDTSIATALQQGGAAAVSTVNSLQGQLAAAAGSLGTTTAGNLYNAGIAADQAAVDGLKAKQADVTGAMGLLEGALGLAVGQLGVNTSALMKQAGSDLATGLSEGIKGKKSEISQVMADLGASLVKTLKKKLGIHSPSTVFAALGRFTGAGMATGLEDSRSLIEKASDALVPVAPSFSTPEFTTAAAGASGGISQTWNVERMGYSDHEIVDRIRTTSRRALAGVAIPVVRVA